MILGMTGTRNGLTPAQRHTVRRLLLEWRPTVFHHGACVGADAEVAKHVAELLPDCEIIAHPGQPAGGGSNEFLSLEAVSNAHVALSAKGHFARNRDIVNASDALLACPWQETRPATQTGGGTWMSVEYAERVGKPVTIVLPDGSIG